MGLRLFHITEFAQSLLTPAAQRQARHPAVLLLLASLWLAIAGNLPLWRELARQPMNAGSLIWIGINFAFLTLAVLGIALSLLNWPRLLKPFIIVLLWLCAFNSVLLWTGSQHLKLDIAPSAWMPALSHVRALPWWQLLLMFGVLALAPTIWLWQFRLQRVMLSYRVTQNMLLAVLFAGLLVLVWFGSRQTLLPLLQDQPRWLELLNPFNTLLSLRR